jgi:hypothetical protein
MTMAGRRQRNRSDGGGHAQLVPVMAELSRCVHRGRLCVAWRRTGASSTRGNQHSDAPYPQGLKKCNHIRIGIIQFNNLNGKLYSCATGFRSNDVFHRSSTRGAASTLRQAQTTTPIQIASDSAPKNRACTIALSAAGASSVSVAR